MEKKLEPINENLIEKKSKSFRTTLPICTSLWQQIINFTVQNITKIEPRYTFRSRKRSNQNNEDDIDYQVKRTREILAYIYSP